MFFYRPSFRCMQCRRFAFRDGLRTWFFQPPMPVTGRGDSPGTLFFVCRRCKPRR